VLLQLYAARVANLAAWLVLVWAALRVAPAFKVPFAVVSLMAIAGALLAWTITRGVRLYHQRLRR